MSAAAVEHPARMRGTRKARRPGVRTMLVLLPAAMTVLLAGAVVAPLRLAAASTVAPGKVDRGPIADSGLSRGSAIDPRVVNGEIAPAGRYPFFAALLTSGESNLYLAQFCGGSLVAARIVLTAAHCVDSDRDIDVLVGTNRLGTGFGDRIPVSRIKVHPRWDPSTLRNDLALLYLSAPASVPRIPVIPQASDFRAAPGAVARVAGFGCTQYANGSGGGCLDYPIRMYHTAVPIGTNAWCASVLGDTYFAETMQCAGSTSALGLAPDACFGDSGGPLIVDGPGGSKAPLLAGLVSWGPGCGIGPTAYTRLSRYRDWLRTNGVRIRGLFSAGPSISAGGSSWPVSGDFDGDGRDDVLWNVPGTAVNTLWRGRPDGFAGGGSFSMGRLRTPVVGDFDGDGRDDILWYGHGSLSDPLRRGTASGFASGPEVAMGGSRVAVVGDFDGDGRDDILWYGAGSTSDIYWRGTASGFASGPEVAMGGAFVPVSGDFEGDGRDDILWYGHGSTPDVLWRGTGRGFTAGPAISMGGCFVPVSGDFDGDGRDDVLWYDYITGTGLVWRWSADGFTATDDVQAPGLLRVVAGDFDGNGRADLVMYGAGDAPDLLWRGNSE